MDNGIAPVLRQRDLVPDALDAAEKVAFQFIVGLLQRRFLFGALHDVPDALALGGFQFFLKFRQHRFQMFGGRFGFRDVLRLPGEAGVELVQHGGGVVLDFLNVYF